MKMRTRLCGALQQQPQHLRQPSSQSDDRPAADSPTSPPCPTGAFCSSVAGGAACTGRHCLLALLGRGNRKTSGAASGHLITCSD
ncbi:hypothetical protein P167DRAFT_400597 [Morchella conica CCBAS932]|uniref:Uncharacterized protein n=1 Tax=Morchella conica CCBAS932 TaxID=1392247 RepID=A0A3N4KP07_9PEZI|nr:hypothetical protein P167DRAFT_400597 [Morchella conica CCBAS932]